MNSKVILVVEDDFLNRRLSKKVLQENGYQVLEAKNADEALKILNKELVDLAILDINLDGRKSFPAAEVLRERGVKLIFASGYGSPGLEAPFLEEVILKKPFEASDIRSALKRVVA